MRFQAGNDICLGFWAECYNMGWCAFPPNANVLELGCAEADWQTPMLRERPDLRIIGVDWRTVTRPGVFIRGNMLELEFAPSTFDAIVAISVLEWVGMGHYVDGHPQHADPIVDDGDKWAMALCARWLKPSGWMYLDVPYRPPGTPRPDPDKASPNLRAYTPHMVQDRLIHPHFTEQHRQVFEPDHPDGPYVALHLTTTAR